MSEDVTRSYNDRSKCANPRKTTWCCTKIGVRNVVQARGGREGSPRGQTLTGMELIVKAPRRSLPAFISVAIDSNWHWKGAAIHLLHAAHTNTTRQTHFSVLWKLRSCTMNDVVVQWEDMHATRGDRYDVGKAFCHYWYHLFHSSYGGEIVKKGIGSSRTKGQLQGASCGKSGKFCSQDLAWCCAHIEYIGEVLVHPFQVPAHAAVSIRRILALRRNSIGEGVAVVVVFF